MDHVVGKGRRWWALSALMPGMAMVFIDQSVLPVALPVIQKEQGATNIQVQWAVNSYLLVTTLLLLLGGKIGDRVGLRRSFSWGVFLFAAASFLCGFSHSIESLIFARGLQGIGAALMIPASSGIIVSLFAPEERGKATGINVSVSSLFLIIGPMIGAYLTQSFSWRYIFWVNLPIAALGLVLIAVFLPRYPGKPQIFDWLSFSSFVLFCSSLVILIMQGRAWGWDSAGVLSLAAITLLGAILLWLSERRAAHPFLELSLFRHPIYKATALSVFATQFILSINVYRAIFFEKVLDWTPIKTGAVTVASTFPILFTSVIGGMLSDRYGPRLPIGLGFALLIYSFFWMGFCYSGSLIAILVGLFAFGLGIPLILTPSYASAMGTFPAQKAGIAFGTLATVRSLASTFGVAALGAILENAQFFFFKEQVHENRMTQQIDPELFEGIISGKPLSTQMLKELPPSTSSLVLHDLKDAEIQGFVYLHFGLAFLLIMIFAAVFILYHRRSKHELPETPAGGWD